jgi:hypothetical protein
MTCALIAYWLVAGCAVYCYSPAVGSGWFDLVMSLLLGGLLVPVKLIGKAIR